MPSLLTEHCPDYQHNVFRPLKMVWFQISCVTSFAGCRHQRAWRKVDWVERVAQCCRCRPGCCCFHLSFNCKCCSCFLVLVLYAVLIDEVVVAILAEGPAICFAGLLSLFYFFQIKGTFSIFLKVEAVKLLVSRGADVNYCTLDYSDSSPLHIAVTKLHVEVVKVRHYNNQLMVMKMPILTPPLFILLSPSFILK